jgi:hypothetical protein
MFDATNPIRRTTGADFMKIDLSSTYPSKNPAFLIKFSVVNASNLEGKTFDLLLWKHKCLMNNSLILKIRVVLMYAFSV